MKPFLLSALIAIFCLPTFGQEEKFDVVYFEPMTFENDFVKVEIDDVVSLEKETKFRMTVTNKTNDYIIYNSEESRFDIPDQDVRAKEKSWMIEPLDTKRKVMRAYGEGLNTIRTFAFVCEGFHKLVEQDPYEVDPFRLPPAVNMFEAGPMRVQLDKEKRATGATKVSWDVTYTGQHYAYLYPYKVQVLMPDGNYYASTKNDLKPVIMERGDTKSLDAAWDRMPGGRINDMQKVEMMIHFNGVFLEAVPEPVEGATLQFEWDEAQTREKN